MMLHLQQLLHLHAVYRCTVVWLLLRTCGLGRAQLFQRSHDLQSHLVCVLGTSFWLKLVDRQYLVRLVRWVTTPVRWATK